MYQNNKEVINRLLQEYLEGKAVNLNSIKASRLRHFQVMCINAMGMMHKKTRMKYFLYYL